MTLRVLARAALVVPEQRNRGAQVLGPGSVIDVLDSEDAESPLGCEEVPVIWVDVSGRETTGWLAASASFTSIPPRHAVLFAARDELEINAVDRLRDLVATSQLRDPAAGWTIASWCSIFGHAHLPELHAVIRELGGRILPSDPVDAVIARTIGLLTHTEVTMAEVQETRENAEASTAAPAKAAKSTKKSPAKGAAKVPAKGAAKEKAAKAAKATRDDAPVSRKVAKEPEVPARSMAHTVGAALVPLLKKAKADETLVAVATKLESGASVSSAQLTKLRDGVNACAQTAREKDKGDLASQLSNANKLVRRLLRKAAA